jgi:hypothetical protein
MIDLSREPSKLDIRLFGLVLAVFFGVVGLIVWRAAGSLAAGIVLWSVGAVLALVYYAVRPMRLPLYGGWMTAIYPLGWLVSRVALAAVYFAVITPIGLAMRLFGWDPLNRRLDPRAGTYWVQREPADDIERFFKQF